MIVDPIIEHYMHTLARRSDHPVLDEMEAFALEKSFPIVGRLVGISLEIYAKMIGARRVFEFGSGYGYSAYWLAGQSGLVGRLSVRIVIRSIGNRRNNTSLLPGCGRG